MIPGMSETIDPATVLALLPHRPPMRLVDRVERIEPGELAVAARTARAGDWYFAGHFPGDPVVPACVLVELLAQTGGLAAVSGRACAAPVHMRLAALGGFKFPAGATPGAELVATATVRGRLGSLVRIEGEVTADGRLVAIGSLTLAELS
jgi:3-hydroxyacyl-[acyl-carrier-protein] dehydratase